VVTSEKLLLDGLVHLACFVTVFLLSGPAVCGCLGKSPGGRHDLNAHLSFGGTQRFVRLSDPLGEELFLDGLVHEYVVRSGADLAAVDQVLEQ